MKEEMRGSVIAQVGDDQSPIREEQCVGIM